MFTFEEDFSVFLQKNLGIDILSSGGKISKNINGFTSSKDINATSIKIALDKKTHTRFIYNSIRYFNLHDAMLQTIGYFVLVLLQFWN